MDLEDQHDLEGHDEHTLLCFALLSKVTQVKIERTGSRVAELGMFLQASCSDAASFDLTAEILAGSIVEIENATKRAIQIRDNPALAGFDLTTGQPQPALVLSCLAAWIQCQVVIAMISAVCSIACWSLHLLCGTPS